MTNFIRIIT